MEEEKKSLFAASEQKRKGAASNLLQGQGSQNPYTKPVPDGISYSPVRRSAPNYGSTSQQERSFETLQNVRNLRSIRSHSSKHGHSGLLDNSEVIYEGDNDEYTRKKYGLIFDDYLLFGSVICLIVFQVLVILKENGDVGANWGEIFVVFEVFLAFTSLFVTKKIIKYLYLYLESKCQRWCLYILHFFTVKAIILIAIFSSWKSARPDMFENLTPTLQYLAILQCAWILVTLMYTHLIRSYSSKLYCLFLQNQILLLGSTLIWLYSINNAACLASVLALPYMFMCGLNIMVQVIYLQFDEIEGSKIIYTFRTTEFQVNAVLLGLVVLTSFMIDDIFEGDSFFSLIYWLYVFFCEIFLYKLAVHLHAATRYY